MKYVSVSITLLVLILCLALAYMKVGNLWHAWHQLKFTKAYFPDRSQLGVLKGSKPVLLFFDI